MLPRRHVWVPLIINLYSDTSQEKCDIVVLFLHWGEEYSEIIHGGVVGFVKNLTRDVKIDLIVGSHPHVTQKHWYTGNTLVATSLGNLLFMPFGLANFVSTILTCCHQKCC